jgi:DNA topoisomerase-1
MTTTPRRTTAAGGTKTTKKTQAKASASKSAKASVKKTAKRTTRATAASVSVNGHRRDGQNIVVVESPAKARTLGRILGDDYHVMASMGHVRDLPDDKLGVDVQHDFQPEYLLRKDKAKVLQELRSASRNAPAVYLATDPDREGEAISWHLLEAANIRPEQARRVVFHEITADAIRRAFQEPREIDRDLVDAQQARRVLDRLVGYLLSPLLWKKVRRGLSAGRVQSAALRLVVDREREIEAFVSQEYWTIEAELASRQAADTPFTARLHSLEGQRKALEVPNEQAADELVADLRPAAYQVKSVRKRETARRPAPPFITSTLQQEASRKLRFTARRTMTVAQQLYEGLPVNGEGPVGLITYMRTDSTSMAQEAVQEARGVIERRFGREYVPKDPRVYTKRVKGAQEAHEAIRPTSFLRDPESLRNSLTREQLQLYQLIWQRALASQIADARFDQTSVEVSATRTPSGASYLLRASGSVMTFAGFLAVYREGLDEPDADDDEGRVLPELREGQPLDLQKLDPLQHFTQPPPRYTEATLIKALEERGIGRPSTYAPILSTIQDRGYVDKTDNRFRPLKLGTVVADLLKDFFPQIVDLDFTSGMEEELDEVARGERQWVPLIKEFYTPFDLRLQEAADKMPRVRDVDEASTEICPVCGAQMVIKRGRFGPFLSCSRFPECKGTKRLETRTGARCPECGGELVERRSTKTKRTFWGCSNYPACSFLVNEKPLPQPCPQCGGLTLARGREGAHCHDKECGWQGTLEELTAAAEEGMAALSA